MASAAPLRISRRLHVHAAHARLRREGHEGRAERMRRRARGCHNALLRQDDDAPALRGLVGEGAICAASASVSAVTPGAGKNSVAWRLPRVMVPVLSRRRTSTSPAASTARPEVAMTFAWIMRSMPAMPIAERSPPMVVGMRQTSNATSTVMVMGAAFAAPSARPFTSGDASASCFTRRRCRWSRAAG